MDTRSTVATAPVVSFESIELLARALKPFTSTGARARLKTADGVTREVRLLEVFEVGAPALGVIAHDPNDPRYITTHSRPTVEELERVELVDVLELTLL